MKCVLLSQHLTEYKHGFRGRNVCITVYVNVCKQTFEHPKLVIKLLFIFSSFPAECIRLTVCMDPIRTPCAYQVLSVCICIQCMHRSIFNVDTYTHIYIVLFLLMAVWINMNLSFGAQQGVVSGVQVQQLFFLQQDNKARLDRDIQFVETF